MLDIQDICRSHAILMACNVTARMILATNGHNVNLALLTACVEPSAPVTGAGSDLSERQPDGSVLHGDCGGGGRWAAGGVYRRRRRAGGAPHATDRLCVLWWAQLPCIGAMWNGKQALSQAADRAHLIPDGIVVPTTTSAWIMQSNCMPLHWPAYSRWCSLAIVIGFDCCYQQ